MPPRHISISGKTTAQSRFTTGLVVAERGKAGSPVTFTLILIEFPSDKGGVRQLRVELDRMSFS